MAEEKPKGDPVVLTFSTGERVTLPGVSSLNTDAELEAAAQNWIAKNYKGPEVTAPVVFRTPKMAEQGGFAPGEEITVRAIPTRPFEGSVLDAATTSFQDYIRANPIGLDPETMQFLAPAGGASASLANVILNPIASALDVADASTTAAISGLSQLAYNLGLGTQRPERTAASAKEAIDLAGLFAAGLAGPNVPRPAQLVREAPLPTPMQTIAQPTAPAPVVPTTLRRAQAVETPEAPVLTAEVPEVTVAPTIPQPAPALTPERLADIRTNAETVLQDMAAGTPEAPLPERIGALKTTNFTTPDETKQFLAGVAKANKEFPEARRGTMTIEQINELSKDVNLNQLLGRKVGMPLNAEQIQAAKTVVYETADDAIAKAKAWVASGGQDATAFQEALDSMVSNTAMFETLQGASSELGRALRVVRERPSVDMSLAMKQLLEQRAKGVPVEELMQRLATFDDPKQAAEFIGKISKPNFRDKFEEYYINALLSGPQTQSINIASNALTTLSSPVEKAIEAGIGAVLRTPDRVTFRELGARLTGMGQGALDGLRLAKQAFVTGEAPSAGTQLDMQRRAIGGITGEIVRLPSRFLMTQDEFFKAIHTRGELAAQAYAKAFKESGGKKEKLSELYQQYLNEPTEAMTKAARREADYRTFQSELGRPGKFVQRATNEFFLARYIMPFVKTPFNLLKYAAERSALAPLSDRWRAEIKAGGRQRNEALAKLTLGTAITGTIAAKALEGMVTGSGPTDPEERAALMATGWQPYSFKIGDTYYPYGRLDPFGTPIGVVADLVTMRDYMTDEEYEKAAALIPFSVATNLAEKTYLQGATNLFEALFSRDTTPQRIESYFRNAAASLIPNIARQTANAVDPQLREANSLIQEAQNRIPVIRGNGFSLLGQEYSFDAVPERLDVWGEPVSRTGFTPMPAGQPTSEQLIGFVRNLTAPVKTSKVTTDPVKKEVARLQLGLERPDKKVSLAVNVGREEPVKFEIELTDRERRQFTFASGVLAKALVEQDIKSPEWKKLTDDERREKIRDRMTFSRKAFRETIGTRALERYLSENNDLPKIKP